MSERGGMMYFLDDSELIGSGNDDALKKQEGGAHYKSLKIQPVEYINANNLSYLQGNVVKYITRYRDKNGIEDLNKAIHYIELIKQLEFNDNHS